MLNAQEHYRKLTNMYLGAKMHEQVYTGLSLDIQDGRCTVQYMVDDRTHHGGGAMHGAVYFKLLDDAAYFAVASRIFDVFTLTKNFEVDLIRPHIEGKVISKGWIEREVSPNEFIAHAVLTNEDGKVLANGRGIFVRGRRFLGPELGYK